MPRSWFRHEANARNDPAIRTLVDRFGLAGETLWWRLLEVRCQEDRDITATPDELAHMLGLHPSDKIDMREWLEVARDAGLIRRRTGRRKTVNQFPIVRDTIVISSWSEYQPEWLTTQAATERKRRSRARTSRVTTPDGHSDVTRDQPVTSQPYGTVLNETVLNPPTPHASGVGGHGENATPTPRTAAANPRARGTNPRAQATAHRIPPVHQLTQRQADAELLARQLYPDKFTTDEDRDGDDAA